MAVMLTNGNVAKTRTVRRSATQRLFSAANKRARPGVSTCRFFWTNSDEVAVLADAESAQVFDEPPKPEMTRALFGLADIARQTATERWIDPRDGMAAYRAAGR
jgi:hypothetical protein